MTFTESAGGSATHEQSFQDGWDAALCELHHQAIHLEARGAHRAAVTLYDAIRLTRSGGLNCEGHPDPRLDERATG